MTIKVGDLNEMIESIEEVTLEFARRPKREELLYSKKNLKEVTLLAFIAQGFRVSDYMKF